MKKVLIVEDMFDMAIDLMISFDSGKYNVEMAGTKEDALGKIQAARYDLIITDGRFPEKKGESAEFYGDEICRAAKGRSLETIVIGYSAAPEDFKAEFDQKYSKIKHSPAALAEIASKYLADYEHKKEKR